MVNIQTFSSVILSNNLVCSLNCLFSVVIFIEIVRSEFKMRPELNFEMRTELKLVAQR